MGDNSSPAEGDSSEAYDERREEIDVDAVEPDYADRTDPVVPSGPLAMDGLEILGFVLFAILLGAATEFGQRVGRDLYRSYY